MAVARAVTFEGVAQERIDEVRGQVESGERPEGFNPQEIVMLHDPESQEALVVIFFDNEEDYKRGDEVLSAMPAGETPGQRTSVRRYDVPLRMTM